MNWRRIVDFCRRWRTWLLAAAGILVALSAGQRARKRLHKATGRIRDIETKAIEDGFREVDADVADYLTAQQKAKQANDKLATRLDQIAKSDDDAARIISDWNADNRLRDDV